MPQPGPDVVAVKIPSLELIDKVRETVCTAMILIGVNEFAAWQSGLGQPDDLADLVVSIYAAMRAQQIALEAQISADGGSYPI